MYMDRRIWHSNRLFGTINMLSRYVKSNITHNVKKLTRSTFRILDEEMFNSKPGSILCHLSVISNRRDGMFMDRKQYPLGPTSTILKAP